MLQGQGINQVCPHLVLQVLTETATVRVDANLDHEQVAAADEIGQSFICNYALPDCLAQRHGLGDLLFAHLQLTRKQQRLKGRHSAKLGMSLVIRVDKVLNLSLPHMV